MKTYTIAATTRSGGYIWTKIEAETLSDAASLFADELSSVRHIHISDVVEISIDESAR